MKKLVTLMAMVSIVVFSTVAWAKSECTTIKDGKLETYEPAVITLGFDDWGYNYRGCPAYC